MAGSRGRKRMAAVLAAAAMGLAVTASGATAATKHTPVIFVHGNSGSAQQFETNAMRFTSNGYRHRQLYAYEYDTSGPSNDAAIEGLDPFIARVKKRTRARKVDVLAHSRGTTVMHAYLNSSAERAAQVRRYVNFDGRSADAPPGGVRTLAVWGEGPASREIAGAENVRFPNKAHTEVTTSAAAFGEVYEFLNGEPPATKRVRPQRPSRVKVAGRALTFPDNQGAEGGRLEIWRVNARTGRRLGNRPQHSVVLGPDGSFGPVKVHGKRRYEFALTRLGSDYTVHNYPEPFERTDRFYRVLDAPILRPFIETGPGHTSLTVTRMREFWGDARNPDFVDRLAFNGVDVINPQIAPRARRVLAVFNFDRGSDGVTDLTAPLAPFSSIPFLTGVDNYLPATPDASGTIRVRETMRGKRRHTVTTAVPNWPSGGDTVSVYFKDYPAQRYGAGKPR